MSNFILEAYDYNRYNLLKNISTDKSIFKIPRKKHQEIYFDKNLKNCKLSEIHILKPIIKNINDLKKLKLEYKTYISYIKDLYNISEEQAVQKLIKFNGNVYLTIIFG